MAKTSQTTTPAPRTLADIKADQKRLAEEIAAAKAAEAQARKDEEEAAQAKLEEDRDEARIEAINAAREWLKCKPAADDYLTQLTTTYEAMTKLVGTFKPAKKAPGVRLPRTNNGPNTAQKRMLAYLLDNTQATRTKLCEVGTGRQGKAAQLNGSFVGNNDATTRDPLSLWGRGLIESKSVQVDINMKPETMFVLTKDGKVAAKEAKTQLEAAAAANGQDNDA